MVNKNGLSFHYRKSNGNVMSRILVLPWKYAVVRRLLFLSRYPTGEMIAYVRNVGPENGFGWRNLLRSDKQMSERIGHEETEELAKKMVELNLIKFDNCYLLSEKEITML